MGYVVTVSFFSIPLICGNITNKQILEYAQMMVKFDLSMVLLNKKVELKSVLMEFGDLYVKLIGTKLMHLLFVKDLDIREYRIDSTSW